MFSFNALTRAAACAVLTGTLIWPAPSLAADAAATAPALTLSEALERAARNHPSLARFPHRLQAADALRDQAGRRRNPELGLEVENVFGSGALGGTDAAEYTLSLSQVLETGGKRGLRTGLADAERAAVRDEQRRAELDVVAETARRFVAVVEAQQLLELARERMALADRAYAQVATRVEAGRTSVAERHKARVAVLEARLAAQGIQRELDSARRELMAMFGEPPVAFGEARGDLFTLAAIPELSTLEARLLDGPDLARYANAQRRAEAEVALARSVARQDITVGGGVRRFQATGDTAFTLGLSMPLGIADRNQGNVAAARARLDELGVERDAARIELHTLLAVAWDRLASSRDRAVALRGEVATEAEQALAVTEQGYAAGRLSWLELSDAQQLLLGVRSEAIHAAAEHHRIRIELERLTGRAIDAP